MHHPQDTGWPRHLAVLASLAAATLGCGVAAEEEAAHGRRVTVIEQYGPPASSRRVTVAATLVPTSDGKALELAGVEVSPEPGTRTMVRKVEALLEDVALTNEPGATWARPARSVPDDARPELARLQLALALLAVAGLTEEPPVAEVSKTHWSLGGERLVAGLTRVRRDGALVRLETVTLLETESASGFAVATLEGTPEADGLTLRGTRRFAGHAPEPVSLEVRETRVAPSTPVKPASTGTGGRGPAHLLASAAEPSDVPTVLPLATAAQPFGAP